LRPGTRGHLESAPDEAGIRESEARTRALVPRENSRGIPSSRIVLAGFSQGGAIALQAGLRHPEPLAGILALSTLLPLRESLDAEAHAASRATPLFLAHGTLDPLVPIRLGERTREFLEQCDYAVEWRAYPMPHAVCAEQIGDLRARRARNWCSQRPPASRASRSKAGQSVTIVNNRAGSLVVTARTARNSTPSVDTSYSHGQSGAPPLSRAESNSSTGTPAEGMGPGLNSTAKNSGPER